MIKRESLRNKVVAEVWQLMLDGELRPGARLNETVLAAKLGVSRTPLREALLQLERDGFLNSSPGKGFSVEPLSSEDVRELYPLRSLLEPYALQLAGLPDAAALASLRLCHEELALLPASTEWVERDEELHEMLIQHCPNRRLLSMIDSLRRHARRYSTVFLRTLGDDLRRSVEEHEGIVSSLEAGDLDAAYDYLVRNLTRTQVPLIDWLAENPVAGLDDETDDKVIRREPAAITRPPRKRSILRVGVLSPTTDLDPRLSFDVGSAMILGQVFETPYLQAVGEEPMTPLLFSEPLASDPPTENRVFSAAVRRDVQFSDGSPLTPEQIRDQLTSAPVVARQASSVRLDGDRMIFELHRPNARFDLSLTLMHCAMIRQTKQGLLGTGPYMLDPSSPPEALRLVRNPFHARPAEIDEVIFTAYPPDADGRPTELVSAVRAGEVDFTNTLSRLDLPSLHGFVKSYEPGHSTAFLAFNTERPALSRATTRTAIALAIDRTELAAVSYSQPSTFAASGLLPPLFNGGDDWVQTDPDRAAQLFAELESPPSSLDLLVIWSPRPYLPDPLGVARKLRCQIERLGIELTIRQSSSREEHLQAMRDGAYDLLLTGHVPDTADPVDMYAALLASYSVPGGDGYFITENNYSRFASTEMDRAIAELRATQQPGRWSAVTKLLREHMPLLPLLYGPATVLHRRNLHGFQPSTIVGWPYFGALTILSEPDSGGTK